MTLSAQQILHIAIGHHDAGRIQQAEALFRQVIAKEPDNAKALFRLGSILGQSGRLSPAIEFTRRAIAADPLAAEAHCNLGEFLRRQGRLDEAIAALSQAVRIDPQYALGWNNLAVALTARGQISEAVFACRQALAIRFDYADAWCNLGVLHRKAGELAEAETALRKAIELSPELADAHSTLGMTLKDLGRIPEALAACQKAAELAPDSFQSQTGLGILLAETSAYDAAIAAHKHAVRIKPDAPDGWYNLATALRQARRLDDAMAAYAKTIHLKPDHAESYANLGATCKDVGRLDLAIEYFRKAIDLWPELAAMHSNLLYTLWFHEGYDGQKLLEEHREFARRHTDHLIIASENAPDESPTDESLPRQGTRDASRPGERLEQELSADANLIPAAVRRSDESTVSADFAANLSDAGGGTAAADAPHDFSPDRRLRIGYVSPDFRRHSAACFILPLLENHDPERVELFCYSGVKKPDEITARCESLADVWRNVVALRNAELADRVRKDRIDVLVDLSLHMAGNRMQVFARKPAPVQVTWLGYPGTTGVAAIDYRLTDPHLDPPGADWPTAEKPWRLPHSFWCYRPIVAAPAPNDLPALRSGAITFGCFNNFCKVTPATKTLWISVLQSIPGSRLIVQAPQGRHRDEMARQFTNAGLTQDRLEFVGLEPGAEYFRLFHRVDLCLDPLPYPGHTTTMDSLWMGVPAVTLSGTTPPSRGGVSLLTNVGLKDFIATTREEYVDIARRTAGDLIALARIRATLRDIMSASPLTDARQFARDMEAAFRGMWRKRCLG
jgi:predicted O-linked N-acetylglucosamine transferase (SPINDLY family)